MRKEQKPFKPKKNRKEPKIEIKKEEKIEIKEAPKKEEEDIFEDEVMEKETIIRNVL